MVMEMSESNHAWHDCCCLIHLLLFTETTRSLPPSPPYQLLCPGLRGQKENTGRQNMWPFFWCVGKCKGLVLCVPFVKVEAANNYGNAAKNWPGKSKG